MKFTQIMVNLLSNAVKFTPDGGSVRVAARRVRSSEHPSKAGSGVRSEEKSPPQLPLARGGIEGRVFPELISLHSKLDTDFMEISVADTGIGIRQEDPPRLFKEVMQLESPYIKKYSGAGVGLVLTRQLVELHRGRIWAESEFGKGSRFTFVIPIRTRDNIPEVQNEVFEQGKK
jgi:signal transduction histidine kinase